MGIDCKIYLPANVAIDNVANVIGILAGAKSKKHYFQDDIKGGWSTEVEGVKITTSGIPTCAYIEIQGLSEASRKCRENNFIHVLYHFETPTGERLLMPSSNNFWIAISKKLVDFFGGRVDFNDCDSVEINYKVEPKEDKFNNPQDGDEWYNLQNRLLELKPLTDDDFQSAYT